MMDIDQVCSGFQSCRNITSTYVAVRVVETFCCLQFQIDRFNRSNLHIEVVMQDFVFA